MTCHHRGPPRPSHPELGVLAALAGVLAATSCVDLASSPPPLPAATAIPSRPPSRSIRVQIAFNDDSVFVRARWPSNRGDSHGELTFVGGAGGGWRASGGGFRDLQASIAGDADRGDTTRVSAEAEVVLSVSIGARSVGARALGFEQLGCFVACHETQSYMPGWRASDGPRSMSLWPGLGGIVDLWVWRAYRTRAADVADDLAITTVGTVPDDGEPAFESNALVAGRPALVFDPRSTGGSYARPAGKEGGPALRAFDDGSLGGSRALAYERAISSGYVPRAGDAVPAYRLRRPRGSRADVRAVARYNGGWWDVTLSRALVTGDTKGDVALAVGETFDLAVALHTDRADGRDHYVSLPFEVTLGTGSGIRAIRVAGRGTSIPAELTDESKAPWTDVPVFLPGVTSMAFLVGAASTRSGFQRLHDVRHGGAAEVASASRRCDDCHRVRAEDARPRYWDFGALDRLVLRRGGVYEPTPFFDGDR